MVETYINGTSSGSSNLTLASALSDKPLEIGRLVSGGSGSTMQPFAGSIDNIETWNIALNQSEIQSYMINPPSGNEAGLIGYWDFNEGNGNTVNDLTSNGNNGTNQWCYLELRCSNK